MGWECRRWCILRRGEGRGRGGKGGGGLLLLTEFRPQNGRTGVLYIVSKFGNHCFFGDYDCTIATEKARLAVHTNTYMLDDQPFLIDPQRFFHNAIAWPELVYTFKP